MYPNKECERSIKKFSLKWKFRDLTSLVNGKIFLGTSKFLCELLIYIELCIYFLLSRVDVFRILKCKAHTIIFLRSASSDSPSEHVHRMERASFTVTCIFSIDPCFLCKIYLAGRNCSQFLPAGLLFCPFVYFIFVFFFLLKNYLY